jgi:lipopolysaccharide/colanic/teichoic acid biosynthesis glycosyltransferase
VERFFDIIFSFLIILILSPILSLIFIILKYTGEGDIFFFQDRIGKDGKCFRLYKFATMLRDSPNIATGTITIKDDPRILPLGKILRKTKINELPQLYNILVGNMSFIGPRPMTVQNFNYYGIKIQNKIKMVRPGLSGIGSIIFRDEEEILENEKGSVKYYNNIISPYKGELESWYVKNKSIYLYFLLCFITILVVFFPKLNIIWIIFKNIPKPPKELQHILKYR